MRIAKGLVVFLAFVVAQCFGGPLIEKDVNVTLFSNEIRRWARVGYRTKTLDKIINELALPNEFQRVDWRTFTGERANAICTVCKSVTKAIISLRRNGTPLETIQALVANLCTRLNIQPERVCIGAVELNTPIILYIVDSNPTITPDDICGVALQDKSCSTTSDKYEWSLEIDENLPKLIEKPITGETVKIVHISDIHYDPLYEPSGNSQCDEPTCCRKGQNVTNNSGKVAGYWGDYNDCDSPWHAVVDALDHIKTKHQDITYIYFTGDIIDHGVWETTKEGNIESLVKSYEKMKDIFENIPVYPILGNHEPNPLNVFAPDYLKDENLSTKWVYELLADLWINHGWLPESTRETILQGGFYTVSPRKGFRIIALNSNVCYSYNWWLLHEPRDPNGQLRWLADTLLKAEEKEEYVHILSHIPSGSQTCHVPWSREYRKIVNRFAHIISSQFNGHTHFDEFNVYYDLNDSRKAVNIAWNGGSLTPYTNLNPNYKLYTVNANTFIIEEADTWIYNLTEANETPNKRPRWYKSYSFKEEYNLEDLSPGALHEWIVKMSQNISLLDTYNKHFHKHAAPPLSTVCDSACLTKHLCNIVTSAAGDNTQCDYITKML